MNPKTKKKGKKQIKGKAKVKSKPQSKKVKRGKNGQILRGSSGLPNSGRPIGARSTGKQIKSAKKSKSNLKAKSIKSVSNTKKLNKLDSKKTPSKIKRNTKGFKRNSKGRLLKGTKGINPKGRPSLGLTKLDNLTRAISEFEMDKKKDLLQHFIKRAFKNDTVLIALMKKRHPDLKSVFLETNQNDAASQQQAADIRKIMRKRFEPVPEELRNLRKENAKLRYDAGLKNENQIRMESRNR